MANLTRLSVLIAESDGARSQETAALLLELGVRDVVQVSAVGTLFAALSRQAFDVLICAERLGNDDGVSLLRAARKAAPATRCVLARPSERAGDYVPEDVEALELPFSRLALQGLLHRAASPQGGLWCEVPELSLTDILQMYHQARRSITVLLSGPVGGRVWLESGEIVDAESGNERGMGALMRLLEAESGLLRTEPPGADVTHTISAPFQSVVLEAAHRLDERRRDSMANAFIASEPTSVSSEVLRPAHTPMLHAHAPNPESFLVPNSRARGRRQALVAIVSIIASLVFVGLSASFLAKRLDGSTARTSDPVESEAAAPGASEASAPSEDTAAANTGNTGSANPSTASTGAANTASENAPERAADDVAAEAAAPRVPPTAPPVAPAPAVQREPVLPPPDGFELSITSKPSRAVVTEGTRVLGKTPLTLTIRSSSVARSAREFVLRAPGYLPYRISQGASESNISASALLSPRPLLAESPDGGSLESDEGEPPEPRSSEGQRGKRKDLNIRLRR